MLPFSINQSLRRSNELSLLLSQEIQNVDVKNLHAARIATLLVATVRDWDVFRVRGAVDIPDDLPARSIVRAWRH